MHNCRRGNSDGEGQIAFFFAEPLPTAQNGAARRQFRFRPKTPLPDHEPRDACDRPLRRSAAVAARSFSAAGGIPDDDEHAVGREREELEAAKLGVTQFNRDPLESDETQGNSKDDPILVPSFNDVRTVGVSHNDASYLYWFNLKKGQVHYLPQIEKYFLLYNPEELAKLVKEVEAKQQ